MNKKDIRTPAVLLDLDVLETNIERVQTLCRKGGKALWPMLKTHKSIQIAQMQAEAGAEGFLCGTLDECEALRDAGFSKIMYAYPVSDPQAIQRVLRLSREGEFLLRIDGEASAALLEAAAAEEGISLDYCLIVDCGLHRFGVLPEEIPALYEKLSEFSHLRFRGLCTHPGHVYAEKSCEGVKPCAEKELSAIAEASSLLRSMGHEPDILSSGSTPTLPFEAESRELKICHPGNYVFHDCLQLSLGSCKEDDCSLTVLASIISNPRPGEYMMDAGSKCLGLDTGAHGNDSIRGHGRVKGHPELVIETLSEEVGKLVAFEETGLRVGDRIEIIPNHACSTANLTQFYIGLRGEHVECCIPVDVRSNMRHPFEEGK